jgi:hypothetical protein
MYYYWPAGYPQSQPQPQPQQQAYYRDPYHEKPKTFSDPKRFLEMTLKAIYDERKAQLFYAALLLQSTTPFQKRNIQHALDDEVKHEKMLTEMFERLTGQKLPSVPFPTPEPVPNFTTGLQMAMEDELESAEHYREMYKMTMSHWVRDILFELQTDEMEHATRFAFLRAEL